MIPQIIHYCWFGGKPLPRSARKCIRSWKRNCPKFKIIKWCEKNFDIKSSPKYVQQAYKEKKWAFVTDYVRLFAVYSTGGIYFDTDVELIKPIYNLLDFNAFFGFEDFKDENGLYYIATGLGFGATPNNALVKSLMDSYNSLSFLKPDGTYNAVACPVLNSNVFVDFGFLLNGQTQIINGVCVLPPDFLCPKKWDTGELCITNNTYSIHHFDASWVYKPKRINRLKLFVRRVIGNKIYDFIKMIFKR